MKGLRVKDLETQEPDEIRRKLHELEEALFKHRMKKNTNQLENTMLIRNTRRDIARANTALSQKLRAAQPAAQTVKE